ncbi:inositol polyphosphate 5-phosphatase [Dermatophagoides pteronyssinus]|uniref:Inositol polyphosphate 5-phosphatase n=1 Tax=Dermatophagoides pteronyssinus TaxID=6956 RepID=A0ABQ8JT25_DERPT|nr:inositol polyphosphate 5-phosphatase [Dermatophagoides pteronyssinus]
MNEILPPVTYEQIQKNRFIHGSNIFGESFFSQNELERFFPNHKIRLSIITWNMGSKPPNDYNQSLQELLHLKPYQPIKYGQLNLPEIFVIGLQETPNSEMIVNSLKVGIQAVLGPNYCLLRWSSVGVLHSSIWLRRELLWSCTTVNMIPVHMRPMAANRIRTKGAIALSFSLFGTSFLFINTHLTAHEINLRSQFIFWFGDLNFRLELPIDIVMDAIRRITNTNNSETKDTYLRKMMRSDQLSNLMNRGIIFNEFNEAQWPPPFLPTYKCHAGYYPMSKLQQSSTTSAMKHFTQLIDEIYLEKEKSNSNEQQRQKLQKQSSSSGAYERKIYMEGMRLRNNLMQSSSMEEIRYNTTIMMNNAVNTIRMKQQKNQKLLEQNGNQNQQNQHQLFKSHSLESNHFIIMNDKNEQQQQQQQQQQSANSNSKQQQQQKSSGISKKELKNRKKENINDHNSRICCIM